MKSENVLAFTLYACLSLFIMRGLLDYGPLGYKHDWSFPQYPWMLSQEIEWNIYSWTSRDLGSSTESSGFMYLLIIGLISKLGIGGVIISKLFLFSVLTLSAYFMFLLASYFMNSKHSLFSGLLYVLNPVMFNKIVAGHVIYLFSYAIAPLAFLYFLKSKDKKNLLIAGLLTALTFSQAQFIIMFTGILFLYSLYKREYFKPLIIILTLSILIHSWWILPTIVNFSSATEYVSSASTLNLFLRRSPPIIAVPFLIGYTHVVEAIFALGLIPWLVGGISLLLILTFSVRSKQARFFIFLALIGLFLSKGANPPFGELFLNLPMINIFREISHLLFIPAFAYALLFGFASESFKNKKQLFLIAPLILFALPFLSGDFTGLVQTYSWPMEYDPITEFLASDAQEYRVLWLPMNQPIRHDGMAGVDPMITFSPKPTFNQMISSESDSNRISALVSNAITYNESLDDLLDLLGVRYVFLRNDFTSEFANFSYMKDFPNITLAHDSDKIINYPEINKFWITNITPVNTYINNDSLPLIYASDKSILYSGDLSILSNYKLFSDKPAIFLASQSSNDLLNLTDSIIIEGNNQDIFLMDFAYRFRPSNYVTTSNASEGWAGLFNYNFGWWWFNPDFTRLAESSVLTLTNNSLIIPYNVNPNSYNLLIKGAGSFTVNNLTFSSPTPAWIDLGSFNFSKGVFYFESINFSLLSDIKLINNSNSLQVYQALMSKNDASHNANISYKRINPTLIEVEYNSTKPFFLVFSESFDSNWVATINDSKLAHFKVNGFANAFYINQTGSNKVIINYTKQEIKNIAIIISFITLILITLIISYNELILLIKFLINLMNNSTKKHRENIKNYIKELKLIIKKYKNNKPKLIKELLKHFFKPLFLIIKKMISLAIYLLITLTISASIILSLSYFSNNIIIFFLEKLLIFIFIPLLIFKIALNFDWNKTINFINKIKKDKKFKKILKTTNLKLKFTLNKEILSTYFMLLITGIYLIPGFIGVDFINAKIGKHYSFNGLYLLFILVGYLFYKYKLSNNYLLITALVLTIFCPFLLIINRYILAKIIAIYLFCFLATFVVLELVKGKKSRQKLKR